MCSWSWLVSVGNYMYGTSINRDGICDWICLVYANAIRSKLKKNENLETFLNNWKFALYRFVHLRAQSWKAIDLKNANLDSSIRSSSRITALGEESLNLYCCGGVIDFELTVTDRNQEPITINRNERTTGFQNVYNQLLDSNVQSVILVVSAENGSGSTVRHAMLCVKNSDNTWYLLDPNNEMNPRSLLEDAEDIVAASIRNLTGKDSNQYSCELRPLRKGGQNIEMELV